MVSDEQIAAILGEAKTLRSGVNKLIDAANAKGGRDNITAVAFRLAEEGEEPEEGATLISRTAEQAGLTSERMRRAGDRLRGQGPMPLPHRQRRGLKIAAVVAAVAAVLVGGVFLARQVYFLGTDEDGRVALYRGLPYDLPFGIELYSEQLSIGVQAASLSPERQAGRDRAQAALRGRRDRHRRRHRAARGIGAAGPADPEAEAEAAEAAEAGKQAGTKQEQQPAAGGHESPH